jgi:hypothetical protein
MRALRLWSTLVLLLLLPRSETLEEAEPSENDTTAKQPEDEQSEEEQPVNTVHLLAEIGVVLVESDNKLSLSNDIVNIVLEFPSTFFDNIQEKHLMCDSSDSKINTAEAKALVTASQELYSELLEQLQQKLGGTRAARSKISRETHSTLETTPTVKTSNYKSASYELDDYSQYEDVDPSEVIVAEKFVRIRKLIVTGKFNDTNEVATVETMPRSSTMLRRNADSVGRARLGNLSSGRPPHVQPASFSFCCYLLFGFLARKITQHYLTLVVL